MVYGDVEIDRRPSTAAQLAVRDYLVLATEKLIMLNDSVFSLHQK